MDRCALIVADKGIRALRIFLPVAICLLWLGAAVPEAGARSEPPGPAILKAAHSPSRPGEERVLGVLRHRIADRELLGRVGEKLSVMSDTSLGLAVSLSEQMDGGAPPVKTDIALLLLTALIVLS